MPTKKIEITAVFLRTSGTDAIVEVEIDGKWYEAIRDSNLGPISWIASANGQYKWPLSELNEQTRAMTLVIEKGLRYKRKKLLTCEHCKNEFQFLEFLRLANHRKKESGIFNLCETCLDKFEREFDKFFCIER